MERFNFFSLVYVGLGRAGHHWLAQVARRRICGRTIGGTVNPHDTPKLVTAAQCEHCPSDTLDTWLIRENGYHTVGVSRCRVCSHLEAWPMGSP